MNSIPDMSKIDLTINENNLYLEESFTDLDMASIRRLTPVKPNGLKDKSRQSLFVGHTQLMTPQGALPIQCLLEAKNLREAMVNYPAAMKTAIEKTLEELKKIQQKEDSRIIIPGT